MKIRIGKGSKITMGKGIGEKEGIYPVTKTEKTLGLYGWDSENKAIKGPTNV